jgi:hypothetical protein
MAQATAPLLDSTQRGAQKSRGLRIPKQNTGAADKALRSGALVSKQISQGCRVPQIVSGSMAMAPQGHSAAQRPQPLQKS